MECGVSFSKKDMAPYQKSNELKGETCAREKYKIPTSYQELKKDMKIDENSIGKVCDILNTDNSVSQSSEVLRLPETITQLINDLNELDISNNQFVEIPDLLTLLSNLKKLSIHDNMLKSLPDTIGKLDNLNILNLSHNQLKEVPDNLSNLKNLESLDLSHNEIENLPVSYSKLQRLRQLNISDNQFISLPKCIANGMGTLRILDISRNSSIKMNVIPYSKYLERFYARENKNCHKFPDWILTPKFFNLKEFNLDKTVFDVFSFVGKDGELGFTTVSMKCSNLSSTVLEIMIENMVNLEKILVGNEDTYKSGNVLNRLPIETLKNPGIIVEMNFRATGLPTIPAAINQLCNLKMLDLGLNCISWLPDEFCELQVLEVLKLDGNGLIMLPENIGNLTILQEIRLENNSLRRLPKSFENLKHLKFIDIYNNVLEEFPDVLSKMHSLEGLDVEQNFFTTSDVMIGEMPYCVLRETFISIIEGNTENTFNSRCSGVKRQPSVKSANSDEYYYQESCSISSVEEQENLVSSKSDEENWDETTDSDDEFEPNDLESVNYNERSKQYIPQEPFGFCPADLHPERVKSQVASLRAYGSLPTFKVEQGQFDDA